MKEEEEDEKHCMAMGGGWETPITGKGSEAPEKKLLGAPPTQGVSKASEKNFLVLPQGLMGGGSCLALPQEVLNPGEGRDGGLQPSSDLQSVRENLDPLQKIPWRFVQQFGP